MKKILGITGGIGAGKSLVAKVFAELGATVVDADAIAREILEPEGKAFSAVVTAFGQEILMPNGFIDRKRLAGIVFENKEQLSQLNGLTHPVIFEEMQAQIDRAKTPLVCLDVPLLFSCDFPIFCHKTLAVLAPKEIRIARIVARDHCSEAEAEARIKNQLPDEVLREKADFCLVNDGDAECLYPKVKEIYELMMER